MGQISSGGALLERALGEERLEAGRVARNSKLKIENSKQGSSARGLLEHLLGVPEDLRILEMDAIDASEGDRGNADVGLSFGPVEPAKIL